VYTDAAKFVRAANGYRVQDMDVFSSDEDFLGVVQNYGKALLQKSLVQTGYRVLELSRLMMMKNHHLGIKKIFPQAVPLSTDTDSATYFIETPEDPLPPWAMKRVMPRHADYFDCMSTGFETSVDFCQLVSRHFQMAVEHRRKKALSPFNDKVYQLDGESSRALGHWRNNEELTALVQALIPQASHFS
ncbi:unnamed protein product, partial [Symbiodinium pilosum]